MPTCKHCQESVWSVPQIIEDQTFYDCYTNWSILLLPDPGYQCLSDFSLWFFHLSRRINKIMQIICRNGPKIENAHIFSITFSITWRHCEDFTIWIQDAGCWRCCSIPCGRRWQCLLHPYQILPMQYQFSSLTLTPTSKRTSTLNVFYNNYNNNNVRTKKNEYKSFNKRDASYSELMPW